MGSLIMALTRALPILKVLLGDKSALQDQESAEFMAAMSQFATEFSQPRQSFWGRFIDGLNRLPRPLIAFGSIGFFIFAMVDPIGFATKMRALSLVPPQLWWLLGAVVGFYFGARELHYFRNNGTAGAGAVSRVLGDIARINSLRPQPPRSELSPGVAGISDAEFILEMSDTSRPLSKAAIAEWNKRNNTK